MRKTPDLLKKVINVAENVLKEYSEHKGFTIFYIGHVNITDIDFFLREQYKTSFPLGSYIFVSEYYIFPQRYALRKNIIILDKNITPARNSNVILPLRAVNICIT